jgi:hypothetical protein
MSENPGIPVDNKTPLDFKLENMTIAELGKLLGGLKQAQGTNVYKKVKEEFSNKIAKELSKTVPNKDNPKKHEHVWFDLGGALSGAKGCECGEASLESAPSQEALTLFGTNADGEPKSILVKKLEPKNFLNDMADLMKTKHELAQSNLANGIIDELADVTGQMYDELAVQSYGESAIKPKIGVDIGKPGGDQSVVVYLLGKKLTVHPIEGAIKDALLEVDGAFFVATGFHNDIPGDVLTIKAEKIPMDELVMKALGKAAEMGVLDPTHKQLAAMDLSKKMGVKSYPEQKAGAAQFTADEIIAEGAPVFLSGPTSVTSKPKKSQVISIGLAMNTAGPGEPVSVKLADKYVSNLFVDEPPPQPTSVDVIEIERAHIDTMDQPGATIHMDHALGQFYMARLGAGYSVMFHPKNGPKLEALVDMKPKDWIRVSRSANSDGSLTYMIARMTGKVVSAVIVSKQVGNEFFLGEGPKPSPHLKISGKIESPVPHDVAFSQNGRKIMEISAEGKITVYADTYFSLNGKTVNMAAAGFATEFWKAVESLNPVIGKFKLLEKNFDVLTKKAQAALSELSLAKAALSAIAKEKAKPNHDPSQDPAKARFANVARMLDLCEDDPK